MEAISNINGEIRIAPEEATLVTALVEQLRGMQSDLGTAREQFLRMEREYLAAESQMMSRLDGTRAQYAALIDVLAKKHVHKSGRYAFRPDLGAFVPEKKEQETP